MRGKERHGQRRGLPGPRFGLLEKELHRHRGGVDDHLPGAGMAPLVNEPRRANHGAAESAASLARMPRLGPPRGATGLQVASLWCCHPAGVVLSFAS